MLAEWCLLKMFCLSYSANEICYKFSYRFVSKRSQSWCCQTCRLSGVSWFTAVTVCYGGQTVPHYLRRTRQNHRSAKNMPHFSSNKSGNFNLNNDQLYVMFSNLQWHELNLCLIVIFYKVWTNIFSILPWYILID